jgi:hypothetical protein
VLIAREGTRVRIRARLELLCRGRILRVCVSRRWQIGSLWFCGTLWLALGPVRVIVQTRRVWWEQP